MNAMLKRLFAVCAALVLLLGFSPAVAVADDPTFNLSVNLAMPRIVSIANATEYGTYYTPEEVREIAHFSHQNDMYLHVDGCRLANAVVAHELTLREYTRDLGVDTLSFDGAKNGLMSAEAVVIFSELDTDVHRMQKQAMQLISKMRFISGQFVPVFA